MHCKPPSENRQDGIKKLISQYKLHNLPDAQTERNFFKNMPSLEHCIYHAALAIDHRGKRYGHQRRLVFSSLKKAKEHLDLAHSLIIGCKTFHELFLLISKLTSEIKGIGKLFIYDTALRIGIYRNLTPTAIYLHAGTTLGAQALGLEIRRDYIEVTELPKTLQTLAPDEIESFLCVYKDRLTVARRR